MADKPKPPHPILRRVRDLREQAQERLLRGPPHDKSADQVGLLYVEFLGRYRAYAEMEDYIEEVLADGDD